MLMLLAVTMPLALMTFFTCAAELEAVGSNQGPDSDLLLLGARSDSLPSLDPSLPGEDLFPSYPSIPADLTGMA